MRNILLALLAVAFLATGASALTVIDFENVPPDYWYFSGNQNLGDFYPDLHFGPDATILEDSIYGYNNTGYPPHSGHQVLFSAIENYIQVDFSSPTNHAGVWYTAGSGTFYLEGYDAGGNMIASTSGESNYGFNSFLEINADGIAFVKLHDTGDFYTIDDFEYEPGLPPAPDVRVYMDPNEYPITLPPGGIFIYDGYLVNNTSELITDIDVWTMARFVENGDMFGTFKQLDDAVLPRYSYMKVSQVWQAVPTYTYAGEYEYIAFCGDYPDTKWDSFTLMVTVIEGGLTRGLDGWVSSGWDKENSDYLPTEFTLMNNAPNPFNAQTTISFMIPKAGNISLEIYNMMGQKVATLINGNKEAGIYNVVWDGSQYSSGTYFYKLRSGDSVLTKKMTLLK